MDDATGRDEREVRSAIPMGAQDNYALIVRLLEDALSSLESDPIAAKRHILHARNLAARTIDAAVNVGGALAGWQLRRAFSFVLYNLAGKLRIEQVAAILKMSPGHFSRAFKSSTGMTYSDFVLRARIDLAKRLLLTTDTPISEIALACGLTDQSHLTRIFKAAVGMPPGAWRRRYADEDIGPAFATALPADVGPMPSVDSGLGPQSETADDRRVAQGEMIILAGLNGSDQVGDPARIWDSLEPAQAILSLATRREPHETGESSPEAGGGASELRVSPRPGTKKA